MRANPVKTGGFKPWHIIIRYSQQWLKFIPTHEFETLARQHHQGGKLRKLSRWSQFVALGLDHSGYLPAFMSLTEGKTHDVAIGRALTLPRQSIVVFDRGSTDYTWYKLLNNNRIFFINRQKSNATYELIERRPVSNAPGLTAAQTRTIKGTKANACPIPLRRIGYCDPETGKHCVFLTNNFTLAANPLADTYKARWQSELFFKWVKPNLKSTTFLRTSKNAVLTQIGVAMCVYLLLAYIKFCSRRSLSFQQILRLLQPNLFERRNLMCLLKGDPPVPSSLH